MRINPSSGKPVVDNVSESSPRSSHTVRPKISGREFPSGILEYLTPRLFQRKGEPIAPSAAADLLWELPDAKQARTLEKLEKRLAKAAERVENTFKSSSLSDKMSVLDAMKDDDSLSPWLRNCFRRYSVVLAKYANPAADAKPMSQEELDARIAKLIQNVSARAKHENAQIQLLAAVEHQQGTSGGVGSFTSLMEEWLYEYSVGEAIIQEVSHAQLARSHQMAEEADQRREEAVHDGQRQETLNVERQRAELKMKTGPVRG